MMQQKQSDRAIAKSKLIGRQKAELLRARALKEGEPRVTIPEDATLAAVFDTPKRQVAGPASSLEAHKEQIKNGLRTSNRTPILTF